MIRLKLTSKQILLLLLMFGLCVILRNNDTTTTFFESSKCNARYYSIRYVFINPNAILLFCCWLYDLSQEQQITNLAHIMACNIL